MTPEEKPAKEQRIEPDIPQRDDGLDYADPAEEESGEPNGPSDNQPSKPGKRVSGAMKKTNAEFDIGKELYEWAGALVNAIVLVVLIFAFVGSVIRVDGTSMLPTLEDEEFILVSRLFYTPKTGDIVIFSKMDGEFINEDTGRESPLVKRVIGVSGDTVRIDYNENAVYVNGKALSETYLADGLTMHPMGYEGAFMQDVGAGRVYEYTVPEGCIFVLGDNRNGSRDSRDLAVQEVDERYILGRLLLRITPLNKFGTVK